MMRDRPLFIASCHAPKLLEAINQAFNEIALFIQGSVKRPSARLIAAAGNRVINSSVVEILPDLATAIGFVTQNALWPQPGTPSPSPLDRPLLHEHLQFRAFYD